MQLLFETLFPPRMSVTITFLSFSTYTSQSIAAVTTAPVYVFIARQSRNASKFNRLYHRYFQTDSLLVFTKIICCSRATKLATTGSAPHFRSNFEILTSTLKIGESPFWGGGWVLI